MRTGGDPVVTRTPGSQPRRSQRDWRDAVLAGVSWTEADSPREEDVSANRLNWPGYVPRRAVSWGRATIGSSAVIVVSWDFSVLGGSFGELDAGAFLSAVDA